MEEKMRSLFAEFNIGRLSNPRKSQHGETSDRQDDPQEHGHITSDLNNPCIRLTSLDGKKETRSGGSRARSGIFGSTEPSTPHGWRLLPSTSREMLFSGLIGLSTLMEDSLGSDLRKDY
ncbi:hypothetical protein B296_00037848 [Ensete ventricosum]|uniref:Uncharacterized protein n=1 Tax=Ensete ventricosum TaxID=4639 RepID=A0A426X5V1_ENSVE|nr:hypothetical protein B296_00037848 [Ensete ventricosum]